MDATTALAAIRAAAQAGHIRYSRHARERMEARHVYPDDVREALMTATECRAGDEGKWKVRGGRDLDGDDLTVVVALLAGVVVVTVF